MKVCNNAVFFRDKDGTDLMLRTTEDMNGRLTRREVCSFNSFGDVRTCFDWDTKAGHRDMKDSRGNWQKIADE
jgi:hypothetical protein